jgi:hypothetical protein
LNKYLKCRVWRLAVLYDIYIYVVRRHLVGIKEVTAIMPRVERYKRLIPSSNLNPALCDLGGIP